MSIVNTGLLRETSIILLSFAKVRSYSVAKADLKILHSSIPIIFVFEVPNICVYVVLTWPELTWSLTQDRQGF